jgi:hypothetical protein
VSCRELGNEHFGSIKGGEFLDQLSMLLGFQEVCGISWLISCVRGLYCV